MESEELTSCCLDVGHKPMEGEELTSCCVDAGREPKESQELTRCCLDADFIMEQMQKGLKKMRRDKPAGHDAVIAEMVLDGGPCFHDVY